MELQINTEDQTYLALLDRQGAILDKITLDLRYSQSEKLLPEIDRILTKNNIKKEMLKRISVNCGPGSYTGTRVGVTVANFLAFSLNIPIVCIGEEFPNQNCFEDPVSAKYLKEPFITKEKSRL